MYQYRNRSTRQVVEREQRDPRLDRLSHRWELIDGPPTLGEVVDAPPAPAGPEQVDPPAEPERPARRATRSRSTTTASRAKR